jgi:hypothetical protein
VHDNCTAEDGELAVAHEIRAFERVLDDALIVGRNIP